MKISIIEFSVENFKIFQEKVTFSMLARKSQHTFQSNGENLLKTSLIYGPNASGKSTLLEAFILLKAVILNTINNFEKLTLLYQPFALSLAKEKPIFCEIIFSLEKKILKYNFSFLREEIVTENLFEILATGKEKKYLIRKGQKIEVFADFKKSQDVAKQKTRKEVLFLSAAAQWNNELAMQIIDGLKNIEIISGNKSARYGGYTVKLCKKDESKAKILNFLQEADFSISDLELAMETMDTKETGTVFFAHNKFDAKGSQAGSSKFNLGHESDGTQRYFEVLGPIIQTLEQGKVLLIDEFDNSLHPYLTKFMLELFENAKNNPQNAQLIVTTHDTSLLSHKEFHKEQFWFTEKNKFGAGNLFSLAEFKTQRNDTEFAKKYLEGRFGALPFINFKN